MSNPANEPQDDEERIFVRIVEQARRQMLSVIVAELPAAEQRRMLAGLKLHHEVTKEVICTLADDDYLQRYRKVRHRHDPDPTTGAPKFLRQVIESQHRKP